MIKFIDFYEKFKSNTRKCLSCGSKNGRSNGCHKGYCSKLSLNKCCGSTSHFILSRVYKGDLELREDPLIDCVQLQPMESRLIEEVFYRFDGIDANNFYDVTLFSPR